MKQPVFNVAAFHLSNGDVRHEPETLGQEDKKEGKRRKLRNSEFEKWSEGRHE
jgi:hypothetical protein